MAPILPKMLRSFFASFFLLLLICAGTVKAQKNITYAVTADTMGSIYWNVFRQVDVRNGAALGLVSRAPKPAGEWLKQPATSTSRVAACAFDKKSGRLFFVTMYSNELYAVKVNEPFAVPVRLATLDVTVSGKPGTMYEENNITRMVIGADGNGYALTNDANHLFVFSTGKQTTVKDKGPLVDLQSNGANTIHSSCVGWGGDLVADKYGYLYLINIYNRVFKIDVAKMQAAFTGTITGLPQGFYTNGAAVNEDGKILLGCGVYTKGYYLFDINELKATPIANQADVYNASDLASGNLLFQDNKEEALALGGETVQESGISIWPNPVAGKNFNVSFKGMRQGSYLIQLLDMEGRLILSKQVQVGAKQQTVPVQCNTGGVSGFYIVKVQSTAGSDVQVTRKILVQRT
jgi:hypothetical protein